MTQKIIASNYGGIYSTDKFETSQKHYEAEKKRIENLKITEAEKMKQLNDLIENFENKIQVLERELQNEIENAKNQGCGCILQ